MGRASAYVKRWLEANAECERRRDWRPLADFFAPDATYGWNCGPDDDFMAVGREEIRRLAFGLEMAGLEGWSYPYQAVMVDDRASMAIGLWRQVAGLRRPDGAPYEMAGFGASWFGYADGAWVWQRDFFDHVNAGALFGAMHRAGQLSEALARRLHTAASGQLAPGHYRRSDIPVPLWPVEPRGIPGPEPQGPA
jgi:SnoaL-like domain